MGQERPSAVSHGHRRESPAASVGTTTSLADVGGDPLIDSGERELDLRTAIRLQVARLSLEHGIWSQSRVSVTRRYRREFEGLVLAVVEELLTPLAQAGAGCVLVHAAETRRLAGRRLTITVSDDGQSLDPASAELAARCVSLAALRRAAQVAGGTLLVENRPGEGTSVRVSLPTRRR